MIKAFSRIATANRSILARRCLSASTICETVLSTTAGDLPITTELKIINTKEAPKIPVFRILSPSGRILEGADEPSMNQELATKMYEHMVRIQYFDEIMYNAQRQGRISFYMQASGEEAIHIGAASAMQPQDTVFAQYREQGVLFWRGFTLQDAADQCFSNASDMGKGRQMPVHYGSNLLNYQTISSPLATQLPQAVGAAYACKQRGNAVPICFFGEGAASEGDFHAAFNFSATLEVPLVFFCRNNGYAISTPVMDQFRGDGIASRAAGYGMHVIRVDGNDLLAVKKVTEEARKLALENSTPVLIEAMTYRRGHHSTSDDSTRYRSASEIKHWQDNFDPVTRFRLYMESKGWWNSELEASLRDKERLSVLQAMEKAEQKPKPAIDMMFDDVYAVKTKNIMKQEKELLEHIELYPEYYRSDSH